MRRLLSRLRAAVDDYSMIKPGDGIAVGVSGGKDSVALLCSLAALRRFYSAEFTIQAITLDMGWGTDFAPIEEVCREIGVEYTVKKTDIGKIVFDERHEKSPCSLCARMRRGALHDTAKSLGCNKVALGHHADDAVETFFLNLLYEGRIGCFSPVTYLDRKDIFVIRPLIYAWESEIRRTVVRLGLPVVKSRCPVDGCTSRQDAKELIAQMDSKYRGFKDRAFGALQRSGIDGWGKTSDIAPDWV